MNPIDAGIHDMFVHQCRRRDVKSKDDRVHFLIRWKCKCGKEWTFRLTEVKRMGYGSKWKEEICWAFGRLELARIANEYLHLADEVEL